jgi:hypothetical protein
VLPRVGIVAAALAAALLLIGPASGGPPGTWTQLTADNLVNFAEPGLARTSDGVLHVVWHHPISALSEELIHSAVSPAGAKVGGDTKIVTGWLELNQRPGLVRTADNTLHVFFAGFHTTVTGDPLNESLMEVSSAASGTSWSAPQAVPSVDSNLYGGSGIAAAVGPGGAILTAHTDPGNVVDFGLGGGAEYPFETRGCCVYDAGIGVDAVTGAAVLGWFSNVTDNQGLYTQTITPSGVVGSPAYVPGSATADRKSANQPIQRTPVTGRIGADGVYVAYGAGYPSYTSVNLLRIGGSPLVVARGAVDDVNLVPAPEGRLWVIWGAGAQYVVTRSNKAATRFEPVTRVNRPSGTVSTFGLWGEGSLGRLDLLASTGKASNAVAMYHTQVLPKLSASSSSVKLKTKPPSRRVTFTVVDAGDPLAGATVKFAGKTLTTNASGKASAVVRSGGKATVSKAGYTGTTLRA